MSNSNDHNQVEGLPNTSTSEPVDAIAGTSSVEVNLAKASATGSDPNAAASNGHTSDSSQAARPGPADGDDEVDLLSTLKMPVFKMPGSQLSRSGSPKGMEGAQGRSIPLSDILRARRKPDPKTTLPLTPLRSMVPFAVTQPPVGFDKRWQVGLPEGEARRRNAERLNETSAIKLDERQRTDTEPELKSVSTDVVDGGGQSAPKQDTDDAEKAARVAPERTAPPQENATAPIPIPENVAAAPKRTSPPPTPDKNTPALKATPPQPPADAQAAPPPERRRHNAQQNVPTAHGDDDISGIVKELLDEDAPPKEAAAPRSNPQTLQKAPPERAWYEQIFNEEYFRTLPMGFHKQTLRETQFILQSLSVGRGGRILDLCCGFGRHTIEMAKRGYDMVGLDLSLPLLQKGLSEAQRRKLSIKFIHGDVRELNFNGVFDACFCVHTSFGYFDDKTNFNVFGGIFKALKTGGRFVIEVLNRDYVIQQMPRRKWWEGSDCLFLEEVSFNNETSVLHNKRTFIYDDNRAWEQYIYIRLFSLHELQSMLRLSGFKILEVSGHVAGRGAFFGAESPHIIILAEKPRP